MAALLLVVPAAASAGRVAPFRGAGSWIDIYDGNGVWNRPEAVVDDLAWHGVDTLYIETGNYHFAPAKNNLYRRNQLARFVDAAHVNGIRVVAWYLASLKDHRTDARRAKAAIRFRTHSHQRFDGFGLDIESNQIRSISKRNAAAVRLSRELRHWGGRRYALGAIVPDSLSTTASYGLWPGFPFRSLRRYYDAFLPMAYSTYRAHGGSRVYSYTRGNIDLIRRRTGDRRVPVHVIGGVLPKLSGSEANAVVRAANRDRAVGASFYGYVGTRGRHWSALARLR